MHKLFTSGFINQLTILTCLVVCFACSSQLLASGDSQAKSHFVGLFAGILDNGESENVLGIEYEYKLDSHWGVGYVYEDAKDAHHGDGISSSIAALYYHPLPGWRLGAGIGKEKVGGDHPHSENLTRVGVAYEFHVGEFGIEPSFNIDTVDGHSARVYGVAFVLSF